MGRISSMPLIDGLRPQSAIYICSSFPPFSDITIIHVATTSREAPSAIEKGHNVRCGREVVPKIADAVLEMESVGHRVTVFLVPYDKGICGVAEAKQAARAVIGNGSDLTVAPAERMRELSGVLRLVKAERAKGLYTPIRPFHSAGGQESRRNTKGLAFCPLVLCSPFLRCASCHGAASSALCVG
jgi:hypothetical protein